MQQHLLYALKNIMLLASKYIKRSICENKLLSSKILHKSKLANTVTTPIKFIQLL